MLKYDIKLQWRHGFWLVYFVVSIVYLLIIFSLPGVARPTISLYLVMTDTSVLGVMFVGALVLLEKQQNVMQSIFVTPLRLSTYLISKTISLTLLSVIMSMIIYVPVSGINVKTIMMVVVVTITSSMFILLGIGASARAMTLNQYLGRLIIASLLIILPLAPFLAFENIGWLRIFPSNALFEIATQVHSGSVGQLAVIDILILLLWLAASWFYAGEQFSRHVLLRSR